MIGGEIDLHQTDLDREPGEGRACLHDWAARLPGETTLASTGRAALTLILEAILKSDPAVRRVALPAYICESAVTPFERAGLEVRFYSVDRSLDIHAGDLARWMEQAGASVLLFVDYFGVPLSRENREALLDLKRRFWLIEDCVPGGLIETCGAVGDVGHFSFTSVRKYTPLPDGALIWNRSTAKVRAPEPGGVPEWVRLRVRGKLARGEFLRTRGEARDARIESVFLKLLEESERRLDSASVPLGPSTVALRFTGFDLDAAAERRRENARRLHGLLTGTPAAVRCLTPAPSSFATPIFLPVLCKSREARDDLRGRLRADSIFCAVHWALPPAVDRGSYPESADLSDRVLCLPLDHRCGPEDMVRMHAAIVRASEAA